MGKFVAIQKGTFGYNERLVGINKAIDLHYMKSSKFSVKNVSESLDRIMSGLIHYKVYSTNIYTPSREQLKVFCREENSKNIVNEIKTFINNPYELSASSELECIVQDRNNREVSKVRLANFWWCIDNSLIGDWMAFLAPYTKILLEALEEEHIRWLK